MGILRISNESLLFSYNAIRNEVESYKRTPYPLLGEAAKQRAAELADEMTRRKIRFEPIVRPAQP